MLTPGRAPSSSGSGSTSSSLGSVPSSRRVAAASRTSTTPASLSAHPSTRSTNSEAVSAAPLPSSSHAASSSLTHQGVFALSNASSRTRASVRHHRPWYARSQASCREESTPACQAAVASSVTVLPPQCICGSIPPKTPGTRRELAGEGEPDLCDEEYQEEQLDEDLAVRGAEEEGMDIGELCWVLVDCPAQENDPRANEMLQRLLAGPESSLDSPRCRAWVDDLRSLSRELTWEEGPLVFARDAFACLVGRCRRSLAVRGAIDLTVMLNFIQLVIKADRYVPNSRRDCCLLNLSAASSEFRRFQWPRFMNATWRDRTVHLQSELSGPGSPQDRSTRRWQLQVRPFFPLSLSHTQRICAYRLFLSSSNYFSKTNKLRSCSLTLEKYQSHVSCYTSAYR